MKKLSGPKRFPRVKLLSLFLLPWFSVIFKAGPAGKEGTMALERLSLSGFHFGGPVGARITANIDQWLLPAPSSNPGMLEMFRLRDRFPVPQLVPWAGEFAGKYLISCVQAIRMSDRADLREHTAAFVAELLATQSADGYLGPFPKNRRLLGEWDLWGHYHVMQGLLQWFDLTGDTRAMEAVVRAADNICHTYLDGARRVIDAGSPEMNMAVSHVLTDLYRRTGGSRYLQLVLEIEKDWERTGDYLRTGVSGMPFYKTPLPRWESLHDLQTLVGLWRITGDPRYRDAFISHWRTIRAFDVRNSGAFSGGEQATGNAYAPSAIETCCTVAWMALSVDMLELTGDPAIADELELSTLNGALGAQHPSGRWWTYDTPMNGERKASALDIVFQARAGTPELNCCAVNGPRAPGMLSEWAVMRHGDDITVNWHGPMTFSHPGLPLKLSNTSHYPMDGTVIWKVETPGKRKLRFRIPGWAAGAEVSVAGEVAPVTPGTYFEAGRDWLAGDLIRFHFPMPLRAVAGAREQDGRVSIYRGPLLLAWDQQDNGYDELAIPRLDPADLTNSKMVAVAKEDAWLAMDIPVSGQVLRLRDFASAGSRGTRYRSWLKTAIEPRDPGGNGLLIRAPLRENAEAKPGALVESGAFAPAEGGLRLNGKDQMLSYALPGGFPQEVTVGLRVRLREQPAESRFAQIFSAWAASGDDPLRLVVQNGQVFARNETGTSRSTGGVPMNTGVWHQLAAVRTPSLLTLWLDGEPAASVPLVPGPASQAKRCALGGNPLYTGAPEFLAADFSNFTLYQRALTEAEIIGLAESH